MAFEPFSLEYLTSRTEVSALLTQGKPQEAFAKFRSWLEYPGKMESELHFQDALRSLAQIAQPIAGDELAQCMLQAAEQPNDAQPLYKLGYDLYEQKLCGIAATVLERAHRLYPENIEILHELVSCLEPIFRNDVACAVLLKSAHIKHDLMSQYLLAFHSMMIGDVQTARLMQQSFLVPHAPQELAWAPAAIGGMLARADRLAANTPLDFKDTRGWHAVIHASLLLHLSPYGWEEGMRGRYAFLMDNYSRCKEGIQRVAAVLQEAQLNVPRVIALPDRSSQILGLATARQLGLPLEPWPTSNDVDGPCLFVVYDLDEVSNADVLNAVAQHRAGQLLWSHAACWTDPFPFAADLVTFEYQTNFSPWAAGRLHVNSKTKTTERLGEDSSPDEELVARILEAPADEDFVRDEDVLRKLVRSLKDIEASHTVGIFRSQGPRTRYRIGTPVRSNRFL